MHDAQCLLWADGVREPDDFKEAFAAMDREPPDAILMVSDALTTLNRKRVFEYAADRRLPAIYEYDFLVRDGGLMPYGADLNESFERAGDLVARIFNGAKPGDLPFEQPTRYPFVINLKTATHFSSEVWIWWGNLLQNSFAGRGLTF
jgi:putative ABC transport system substrate-binding protein